MRPSLQIDVLQLVFSAYVFLRTVFDEPYHNAATPFRFETQS